MFCRPQSSCILPAVVHPTKCCVNQTFSEAIVPHIHPVHTTTVNNMNYVHKHYFPKTQSAVSNVTQQHFKCGDDSCPMPMGPGVGGPGMGPGFGGPGMGPGFGGPGMGPGFGGPGMGPGYGGPGMGPGFGGPGMGPGFGGPGMGPGFGGPGMGPGMGMGPSQGMRR
jgi:spore coat protein D